MIILQKEPISPDSERKFRRWLAQSEVQTLRKVVTAQCQFLQADALAKALSATSGDPSDLVLRDEMREAARWYDFAKILDDLCNTPPTEHFTIAKLTPTPTPNYDHTTQSDGTDS